MELSRKRPRRPARLAVESCEVRLVLSAAGCDDATSRLDAPAATTLAAANHLTGLTEVRQDYGFDGAGQTIVVIDSGVAYDHPALGGGFGSSYQVVGGWDFAEGDDNPYDDGPYGSHGTHVAGIIGSGDSRALGVAPGVDLVALRVFDDRGAGNFRWVEQALQWVYDHRDSFANPITTVNLSLGGSWNSTSLPGWAMLEDELARLEQEGIFLAVAAGNGFTGTVGLDYPAISPYVVAAASVDADGGLSSFSQRSDSVIAAPGRSVLSAVPDYMGNRDGRANDFARFSGTSMASPYLAAASALVRQAMEFAGVASVTQDAIYEVVRRTADSVFDSVTRRSYARLNLAAAIDAVMPGDDYGSDAGSAYNLGSLQDRREIDGVISRLDDADFFTFRAAASGTVTITAGAGQQLAPRLALVGGGESSSGGEPLSFTVIAGQEYTVDLRSTGGLGHYELGWELTPAQPAQPPIDWGRVAFDTHADVRLEGPEQVFTLRADATGMLTVIGRYGASASGLQFELFDDSGRRIAVGQNDPGSHRIDARVREGQAYRLHVRGVSSEVDFTIANVLWLDEGRARFAGGAANDQIRLDVTASGYEVSINGVGYRLLASEVRSWDFDGNGGDDSIVVQAGEHDDFVRFADGRLDLGGENYRVLARGAELVTVFGNGGVGGALLAGDAGDDVFSAQPGRADLYSGGVHLVLGDFRDLTFEARGGADRAVISDTAGDDALRIASGEAQLRGDNYHVFVRGAERVEALSYRGFDVAIAAGGSDAERVHVDGATARILSAAYDHLLMGFDRVAAGLGGGSDTAEFEDTAGSDRIEAADNAWRWISSRIDITLTDLDSVRASSRNGGDDRAYIDAVDFVYELSGGWR